MLEPFFPCGVNVCVCVCVGGVGGGEYITFIPLTGNTSVPVGL